RRCPDLAPVRDFLGERRTEPPHLPEKSAAHPQRAPGYDVVERGHAAEQGDIVEGAGKAGGRCLVGPHRRARAALERDAPLLRVVEAINDVEHRGLAGAIWPDDGADLAGSDSEGHSRQCPDAAKRQGDVFDGEQRLGQAFDDTISSEALLPSPLWQGNRMGAGPAVLPLPACHKGVYARLRRAMERDGVRGPFRVGKLATLSLRRGPLTRNLRGERANSDLSPQAGRGEGGAHAR